MKPRHLIRVRHVCLKDGHEFVDCHYAFTPRGVAGVAQAHCEPSYRNDLIVTPAVFTALGGTTDPDGTTKIGETIVLVKE